MASDDGTAPRGLDERKAAWHAATDGSQADVKSVVKAAQDLDDAVYGLLWEPGEDTDPEEILATMEGVRRAADQLVAGVEAFYDVAFEAMRRARMVLHARTDADPAARIVKPVPGTLAAGGMELRISADSDRWLVNLFAEPRRALAYRSAEDVSLRRALYLAAGDFGSGSWAREMEAELIAVILAVAVAG